MAKKAGTYKGKSLSVGGGGRFERLEDKLKASGKSESSAEAIAAAVGRKKMGKVAFQAAAAKGRKRAKGA